MQPHVLIIDLASSMSPTLHVLCTVQMLTGVMLLGVQVDVELVKDGRNKYGSAFEKVVTILGREGQAQKMVDPLKARTWSISNPGAKHPITGRRSTSLRPALHPACPAQRCLLSITAGPCFCHVHSCV